MATSQKPNTPTLEDLDNLPPGVVGEIIEGTLYTMTKPRMRHQRTTTRLSGKISGPFDEGVGGPGGWWIVAEPGIELPNGTKEISPDIAGWRRERMPEMPFEVISVVPDWVCEILSPSTRRHDLVIKRPYYAKIGVKHHWIIDLAARTLTAYVLEQEHWLEIGVYADQREARVAPFAETVLDVASWWS